MKINKASESITYARMSKSENEAPRFLLRPGADIENKGKDTVEISEMGRAKFHRREALNRRLKELPISEETLNRAISMIRSSADPAADTEKLAYIKARVASREYDFSEKEKLLRLAEIAMS